MAHRAVNREWWPWDQETWLPDQVYERWLCSGFKQNSQVSVRCNCKVEIPLSALDILPRLHHPALAYLFSRTAGDSVPPTLLPRH